MPGVLASHKYNLHRGEKKKQQTGEGVRIVVKKDVKTDNEFVSDYLDNNKDKFKKAEWKRLKRKATGVETYKRLKRDKSPTRRNKCKLCSASFLDARELARHNEKQHPMCVHCRRRFIDRKAFDKHSHPTCPMCDKVFIFEKDLNNHLMGHPKCPQCGETFMSESKLRLHVMRAHQHRDRSRSPEGQREPEYLIPRQLDRCPICFKKIEHKHLDRHIRKHRAESADDERESRESDASTMSVAKDLVPLPESRSASTVSAGRDIALPESDMESDASTVSAGRDIALPESDASTVSAGRDIALPESDVDSASTVSARRDLVPLPESDMESDASTVSAGRDLVLADGQDSASTVSAGRDVGLNDRPYRNTFKFKGKKDKYKRHHICRYCGKHYHSLELLNRHVELKHPKLSAQKRYNCEVCAAQFTSTAERDTHMTMSHPRCMLCDRAFATTDEYLRHKLREHPEDRTYDGPDLPSEEEDDINTDEDSIDAEDRKFHKHINCVTIDKFLQINELINQDKFETLASDEGLLEALQIIFKGAIKGYIPLCSPQRLILTKSMKKLMFSFGTNPSGSLLMRNKKNLKQLFKILWGSVDAVIKSYMKYV